MFLFKNLCAKKVCKTPLFFLIILVFLSNQTKADDLVPDKSWAYAPFSIISSTKNIEITDQYIQEKLMCKSTQKNLVDFMNIIQNFDLVGSSAGDGTMSMTTFMGKQKGAKAQITLMVDSRTNVLSYIWVNGKPNLACKN